MNIEYKLSLCASVVIKYGVTMKGLIQVYTGDGKGKTTAAVGLAIRARAHNLRVGYIYFHKEPERRGDTEHRVLTGLGVDIFGFAKKHPHFFKGVTADEIRQECLEGLQFIKSVYQEDRYDLLILDEINISMRDGFLKEEEVLEILKAKPDGLELVLTGRGATQGIIDCADMVSEIKAVKHPYDMGIQHRKGIEY
ncbi:MAG: cob(I)yrinic acid a,c-diamide adenosyltransferase [bacterium]|nr:cob(I)yrinic acid a,c-diamide adenosyltransferase [bacterium]